MLPYDAMCRLFAYALGGVTTWQTKRKRPTGQQEAAPTGRSRSQSQARNLPSCYVRRLTAAYRAPFANGVEQDAVDWFQVDGLEASERVVSEGVVGEGDAIKWGVDKIRHDIRREFV